MRVGSFAHLELLPAKVFWPRPESLDRREARPEALAEVLSRVVDALCLSGLLRVVGGVSRLLLPCWRMNVPDQGPAAIEPRGAIEGRRAACRRGK